MEEFKADMALFLRAMMVKHSMTNEQLLRAIPCEYVLWAMIQDARADMREEA